VRKLKIILAVLLSCCVSACINLGPSHEINTKLYTLSVDSSAVAHAVPTGKTLRINVGEAAPSIHGNAMLYQQNDYQLKEYALHRWSTPPVAMIVEAFENQLTATHAFAAVVRAPMYAGLVDYQIGIELQKLQQNFVSTPGAKNDGCSQEELAVKLIIIDMKKNKVIASQLFSQSVVAGPNAPSGVGAANQALKKLMPQMVQFVLDSTH
jgi:ABC-type uncharacterized transport system auxiliary subunit